MIARPARPSLRLSRRGFLRAGGLIGAGAALAGCKPLDPLVATDGPLYDPLRAVNGLTYRFMRAVQDPMALAQEFPASEVRQPMRPNGSTAPDNPEFAKAAANGFADWRLTITGLVDKPLTFTLDELRNRPARTQITRHDCVEGWSCIAKWTGTPLGPILEEAGLREEAQFVVFRCLDAVETGLAGPILYYESIDLVDARHPQTILAYGMNDQPLPVANGAPLRVRVERQLGYKMAKFVTGIEVVDEAGLRAVGQGHGGYWEDNGYDWYAGI